MTEETAYAALARSREGLRDEECRYCEGRGTLATPPPWSVTCPDCYGLGYVLPASEAERVGRLVAVTFERGLSVVLLPPCDHTPTYEARVVEETEAWYGWADTASEALAVAIAKAEEGRA